MSGTLGLDVASQLTGVAELHALREALRSGPLEISAAGTSMRPLLRAGDRVRLETRRPRRGDIALAVVNSRLVLHRIVARSGRKCQLRGDARPRADGWVPSVRILAVATGRRRVDPSGTPGPWQPLGRVRDRWLGLAWANLAPAALPARRWLAR